MEFADDLSQRCLPEQSNNGRVDVVQPCTTISCHQGVWPLLWNGTVSWSGIFHIHYAGSNLCVLALIARLRRKGAPMQTLLTMVRRRAEI